MVGTSGPFPRMPTPSVLGQATTPRSQRVRNRSVQVRTAVGEAVVVRADPLLARLRELTARQHRDGLLVACGPGYGEARRIDDHAASDPVDAAFAPDAVGNRDEHAVDGCGGLHADDLLRTLARWS